MFNNKLKNKKYHTVGTVAKYNRKIAETIKIDTSNAHIHDRLPFTKNGY